MRCTAPAAQVGKGGDAELGGEPAGGLKPSTEAAVKKDLQQAVCAAAPCACLCATLAWPAACELLLPLPGCACGMSPGPPLALPSGCRRRQNPASLLA